MISSKSIFLALVALVWTLAAPNAALANFSVSPVILDLEHSGSRASTTFRVENTTANQKPLEIRVTKRVLDAQGNETRVPADDDVIAFPPQANLAPKASQTFRVQYVGPPSEAGAAYYVSVVEVPVTVGDNKKPGITFLLSFSLPTYVNPKNAAADVQVVQSTKGPETGIWRLRLKNSGSRILSLAHGEWRLVSKSGTSATLTNKDVAGIKQSYLMPGQGERDFQLRVPKQFTDPSTVQISYTPPAQQ